MKWFKQEAINSPQEDMLRHKFGIEAIGFYTACKQFITASITNDQISFQLIHTLDYLASFCQMALEKVQSILDYMCDLKMIVKDPETGAIFFPLLAKNLDNSIIKNPQMQLIQEQSRRDNKKLLNPTYPQSGIFPARLENKNINKKHILNYRADASALSSLEAIDKDFMESIDSLVCVLDSNYTQQEATQATLSNNTTIDSPQGEIVQPAQNLEMIKIDHSLPIGNGRQEKEHGHQINGQIKKKGHYNNGKRKKWGGKKHLSGTALCAAIAKLPKWSQEGLEKYIALHPKKVAFYETRRAWLELKPDQALIDVILIALQNQIIIATKKKALKKFNENIQSPNKWLMNERWADKPKEEDEQYLIDPVKDLLAGTLLEKTSEALQEKQKHEEEQKQLRNDPLKRSKIEQMLSGLTKQLKTGS